MGVVYRAVSVAGEHLAVKQISSQVVVGDQERERFAQEVEALQAVFGPRVVAYMDADTEAADPWLAVEYVPGPTLRDHVEKRGPLGVRDVAILGAALAEGLRTIHKADLLHRDLKPQNIIMGPTGPIVIDFGLAMLTKAKVDVAEGKVRRLTKPGSVVGTLVCMPPEQVRGDDLTHAADVYALGATLLFAATGHYPFDGATEFKIMTAIEGTQPPDFAGLAEELRPVIEPMLSKDADARPELDAVTPQFAAVVKATGSTVTAARRALIRATARPELDLPEPEDQEPGQHERLAPPLLPGDDASPAAVRRIARRLRDAYAASTSL